MCIGTSTHSHFYSVVSCHLGVLVTDDLKEVRNCIWDAHIKWFHLGVELGLRPSSLEAIRKMFSDDPAECFSQMLINWLAGQGSKPTWKNLSSALNAPAVYLPALAKAAEAKTSGRLGPMILTPHVALKRIPTLAQYH